MSEPIFDRYLAALDALSDYCGSDRSLLKGKESPANYTFEDTFALDDQINTQAGWEDRVSVLANKLLEAGFGFTLTVTVAEYEAELQIFADDELRATCTDSREITGLPPPKAALEFFDDFKRALNRSRDNEHPVALSEVYDHIKNLTNASASVVVLLRASLLKSLIRANLGANATVTQKVVYYLFLDNLIDHLEEVTLISFADDFREYARRTVIVVFDISDLLAGDLLAVCGRGHDDETKRLLTEPLSDEEKARTANALTFRKSETLGDFHTDWLTPDFFVLNKSPAKPGAALAKLQAHFKGFQALLSVLFLADYVETNDQISYTVEYRGIGVVKIPIDRKRLMGKPSSLDALYQLYAYAYEGSLSDKLEIVQQFISLITSNLDTLCDKSTELWEAAKKTYAGVLRKNVDNYFAALDKIQERIKSSVDKSAEAVINLSKEVSGDLYKIAGLIAGAIAGALLKPEFGWLVALTASLVIGIYLSLVIFYYLETLRNAYDLDTLQHTAYIDSFNEILGETKIKKFQDDPHLKNAKTLFVEKLTTAQEIYTFFLILSLLIFAACVYKLSAAHVHV